MLDIKPISKASGILALFAICTTGLVALTHIQTKDKIASEKERAIVRTISQIVPPDLYNNQIAQDCLMVENHQGTQSRIFRARLNENNTALIIETIAPNGYNGRIELLVALAKDHQILGVRTTAHNETPGLGDKIEVTKSNWIEHFAGLYVTAENSKKWAVRKDGGTFDGFTGATITPRAVIKAIKETTLWAAEQESLFSAKSNCGA
ncbi:electron transport complex subunit RsxG [Catenovulum sediminis]|uniref:electron transport complex subunit RsxG n=1 Tax=Catenovulum sediminis TaxID=1740262 RepID=UPI00117CFCDD|nr:electron transport complex subunit RsxG [Catenovulum sediminis]